MRVPYEWLKDYVELPQGPEELARLLPTVGLDVDHLDTGGEGFERVVVGRILSVHPHPSAEKLRVCIVDAGREVLQVVCGAPNVHPGGLAPLALPGAVLPGGKRVEAETFAGVESLGMLCSATELGLGAGELPLGFEEGIMLLAEGASPGQELGEVLGLSGPVLELDITPNRSDCLSIIGVAREVAAITGARLRLPEVVVAEGEARCDDHVRVQIEAPDLCPRYVARVVTGVRVGPSPLWMQRRLRAAGVRPINNIVDVTNYVMFEMGQPLHAFDHDRLRGGRIVVRRAGGGERIVTLDGQERVLDEDVLVIADEERPVAIAGVMGGLDTEVTSGTKTVLLESACFAGTSVRRTSIRLGFRSEASRRFERGVDPGGQVAAADRAAQLIGLLGAGVAARGIVECHPRPAKPRRLRLRPERVNAILGTELPAERMALILESLGFGVEGKRRLLVTVPTRRVDVGEEIDLVEEIARIHGFEELRPTLPKGQTVVGGKSRRARWIDQARDILVFASLSEVVTYSFIDPADFDRLGIPAESPLRRAIVLRNPLSEDQSVMRTTLMPGLLRAAAYNFARQVEDIRIFEIGAVYIPGSLPLAELPEERRHLGMVVSGSILGRTWTAPPVEADFYFASGIIAELVRRLNGEKAVFRPTTDYPFLHPGRAAVVRLRGRRVGLVGELHPDMAETFDLPGRVCVGEIDLDGLYDAGRAQIRFQPLPRFPAVLRDLAVVVPEAVSAEEVEAAIKGAGGDLLESVTLFDVYSGEQVPAGHRSLAYSLVYRAPDRTLKEAEVEAAHARVRELLEERVGARLRS